MPAFQRLSADQVALMRRPTRRGVDLAQYTEFLGDIERGEGGEITLDQGEASRVVKRRLTTAAKRMGKHLKYRRSGSGVVRFEVV